MAQLGLERLNLFWVPPANPDNLGDWRVSDALWPIYGRLNETELTTDQKQLKTISDTLNADRLVPWRKEKATGTS